MADETLGEAAARMGFPDDHTEVKCTTRHDDGGMTCMFCSGGLFACSECGSFEGATTTQCPGRQMTTDESDAVYAGKLDFRKGEWLKTESFYSPGGYRQALTDGGAR